MMISERRRVTRIITPEPVVEGAGVRLRRSVATATLNYLDPFLLFDDFTASEAEDYRAGFPLHPHRGIETVTYLRAGVVAHRDTLGNAGSIGAGDVQWMTAGGGIMHEEMPQVRPEGIAGFQLWVNLPARLKMTRPRYQDIRASDIPEVTQADGAVVRVIAGSVGEIRGPVTGIAVAPTYLDVALPARGTFTHPIPRGHTAFAYVYEGEATFGEGPQGTTDAISHRKLVVWGDGEAVTVVTTDEPVRFLFISGQPLHEPIARYGPFVMNTREEIEQALADLKQGTFVWSEARHGSPA